MWGLHDCFSCWVVVVVGGACKPELNDWVWLEWLQMSFMSTLCVCPVNLADAAAAWGGRAAEDKVACRAVSRKVSVDFLLVIFSPCKALARKCETFQIQVQLWDATPPPAPAHTSSSDCWITTGPFFSCTISVGFWDFSWNRKLCFPHHTHHWSFTALSQRCDWAGLILNWHIVVVLLVCLRHTDSISSGTEAAPIAAVKSSCIV